MEVAGKSSGGTEFIWGSPAFSKRLLCSSLSHLIFLQSYRLVVYLYDISVNTGKETETQEGKGAGPRTHS